MPLIDLTRQAGAASTGSVVLASTSETSSATGLYEVEWTKASPAIIGTGSLDLGSGYILSVGYVELHNNIVMDSGSNPAIELTGGGSVRIYGDLIIEGSQSFTNVDTVAIEDPILNLNYSGSTAKAAASGGLDIGRSGAAPARLLWDESIDRWTIDNLSGSTIPIVGSSTAETLTNKTISGLLTSTMGSGANLTFSGDGEVLGLPATASAAGAATSRKYVQERDAYLRKNYVKKTSSITVPNTASFTAMTASHWEMYTSPARMTATSEDDFLFFINGQYMEHDALTIKQEGTSLVLLVNTGSIGYDLESDDEILAWGKFDS